MLKKLKNSQRVKRLSANIMEIWNLLTDFAKIIYALFGNLLLKGKLYEKELLFVTGSDKYFYESAIQLIDSINRHEKDSKIIFYDLGLELFQIKNLKQTYQNLEYRKFDFSNYPSFFEERDEFGKLGAYAWKSAIISNVFFEKKTNIIWLDAGNTVSKKLNLVRIVLSFYGFYSPISSGTIEQWTYSSVLADLELSQRIRKKRNLTGGIVGLSWKSSKSKEIIRLWFEFSSNQNLISPEGSTRNNHRQDQSLLSIITYGLNSSFLLLKSKKLFSIQVNQNPGNRIYISEGYGDKIIANFRSEWYKINSNISTNTIKNAYLIFITDINNWKKIQKKYLKTKYIVLKFSHNYKIDDKYIRKEILKIDKYVDVYFVESLDLKYELESMDLQNIKYIDEPNSLSIYTSVLKDLLNTVKI